ncbi:hypothetical protein [Streptomyces tendae]|uniref:hypothetical protein n=1 Tax=Streptomyces tendae TaxID=1932 RepID=UPI003431EBB4
MSYPGQRYLGEKGEIKAVFRPADTPPDIVSPGGTTTHYLASHTSTGGEFGLYKVDMGPKAPVTETHFHRGISKSVRHDRQAARLQEGALPHRRRRQPPHT